LAHRSDVPVSAPAASRWLFLLKALFAAGAVVALVLLVEPRAMREAVLRADLRWVLAAVALVPLNVGLEVIRWGRLVRAAAPGVRWAQVAEAVVGSYPLGLLTPGRVGDYVGRTAFLRALPASASAALTFAERMATLLTCLVAGLAVSGAYLHQTVGASPLWPAVLGTGFVGTAALLLALLYPARAGAALAALLPFGPLRRAAQAIEQIPPDEALALLGLSALRYAVFSTQFAMLAHAVAPDVGWAGLYAGIALAYFAKSAVPQVTLGDLGVREGVAVFFLGAYGVPAAAALDASLGIFAINLLLPALIGSPLLLRLRAPARRPSVDAPVIAEVRA
jgi:uncharacterized membrane protein YbhN (UPF0104 family)